MRSLPAISGAALASRVLAITMMMAPAALRAQTAPVATAPATGATTSAAATQAVVRVTFVEGFAQYTLVRPEERTDADWKECKEGQEVGPGGAFRTNDTSRIRYVLPPDIVECEVNRLTTDEIVNIINTRQQIRLDTVMPKGGKKTMSAKSTQQPKRLNIRSNGAALGIRGTEVVLYDQAPFVPVATSFSGQAYFRDLRRQTVTFGGTGTTVVTGTQSNPTQVALSRSAIDATMPMALTPTETALVDNLVSRGAIFEFDPRAGINVVRGGSAPALSETGFAQTLPGTLNFVLRWEGPANLDIGVSPSLMGASEFALPVGGLNITSSGLRIPFDHRGEGSSGLEVAYYTLPSFEQFGPFAIIGIAHQQPPGRAQISAFLNGKQYDLRMRDDLPANGAFIAFFDPSQPELNLGSNFSIRAASIATNPRRARAAAPVPVTARRKR
jgi:hypothetical protein